MTEHPITPPPELVQQWHQEWIAKSCNEKVDVRGMHIATQAARWGADQELEACCELLDGCNIIPIDAHANSAQNRLLAKDRVDRLRAARRPKPPSLKEQALKAIGVPAKIGEARVIEHREHELIRRALQQLPD